MSKLLTPKVLRRGFGLFALVSLISFGVLLFYGRDTSAFLSAIPRIHWGWVIAGIGLASLDWFGGGLRLWVLAREIHPNPPLKGMILAGGMSAWASYLTPLQSGAAPMMIYTMKRYGVPVPVGFTSTLMSFIATVAFFAIAGPLAIVFGAGRSLGRHGVALGISLYDLFLGSLSVFAGLGVLLLAVILFPRFVRDLVRRAAKALGRRSVKVQNRLEALERGIDQTHAAVERFNSPRGWLALLNAIILSGPSHANKLLAGYIALRALGIEAQFVDVLLLQTFITFLLYFAPTPGASGIAEFLSAAVMSIYVPRELTPLYTMLWRLVLSWYTIAFGAFVFWSWVQKGLKGIAHDPMETAAP
jgi:uncharacterized protein (TIRG00374 family)